MAPLTGARRGLELGAITSGGRMSTQHQIEERDLQVVAHIARGPGNYPTPSRERVGRLMELGLVKKNRNGLAPTMKGRVLAWLRRLY
jgi:hypothetical protein